MSRSSTKVAVTKVALAKVAVAKVALANLALGALLLTAAGGLGLALSGSAVKAAGEPAGAHESTHMPWSWGGILGKFDKPQLRRGYQIYKEVCSACHSMKRIRFRNLAEPGGPEFPEDRVKALAASFQVKDGPNDDGEMYDRPARLSDTFVSPFANDKAARAANGGALPPDLSLIARARDVHEEVPFYMVPWHFVKNVLTGYQEGGADYVHAVLTQYRDTPPAGFKMTEGLYYNGAFPGHQIAMPPPLSAEDPFKYQDGTGSLEQNAEDVTAFLAWAANPELEARKAMGLRVMIYLLIMTVLLYLAKRSVWSRVKH